MASKDFGWKENIASPYRGLRRLLTEGEQPNPIEKLVRKNVLSWFDGKIGVDVVGDSIIDKCVCLLNVDNIVKYVLIEKPSWLKYVPYIAAEFFYSYSEEELDKLVSAYEISGYDFASMMYGLADFVEYAESNREISSVEKLGNLSADIDVSLSSEIFCLVKPDLTDEKCEKFVSDYLENVCFKSFIVVDDGKIDTKVIGERIRNYRNR